MQVVLVGNAGVGKTCLVRRFTQVIFNLVFVIVYLCLSCFLRLFSVLVFVDLDLPGFVMLPTAQTMMNMTQTKSPTDHFRECFRLARAQL